MDLKILMGLYIYKDYDEYGDDLFKAVYQLIIDDDESLYMRVVEGPIVGTCINITYKQLQNDYISVSDFILNANYVGYNAVRLSDNEDLNFTGYVDEITGEENEYTDMFFRKMQIILYEKDNNVLIYYDQNVENFEDFNLVKGLFFLNGSYPTDRWQYLENIGYLFEDRQQVILDIYTCDSILTKKMVLK